MSDRRHGGGDGPTLGWRAWFVIGFALAIFFQTNAITAVGNETSLLWIGADYPTTPWILNDHPNAVATNGLGHDGQAFYVVARNPWAGEPSLLLDNPSFRYRRWLYPALAGGFGFASPRATVYGLYALAAFGFAAACAAMAALCRRGRIAAYAPLTVLLSPGLFYGLLLTTAGTMAMALALAGVIAHRSRRIGRAAVLFAAAAATREIYLLFALAATFDHWRRGRPKEALFTAIPAVATTFALTLVWSVRLGGGGGVGPNLALPGAGIAQGIRQWSALGDLEVAWGVLALVLAAACAIAALLALATEVKVALVVLSAVILISGEPIWQIPSNALRVFAAVPPLIGIALHDYLANRSTPKVDRSSGAVISEPPARGL